MTSITDFLDFGLSLLAETHHFSGVRIVWVFSTAAFFFIAIFIAELAAQVKESCSGLIDSKARDHLEKIIRVSTFLTNTKQGLLHTHNSVNFSYFSLLVFLLFNEDKDKDFPVIVLSIFPISFLLCGFLRNFF